MHGSAAATTAIIFCAFVIGMCAGLWLRALGAPSAVGEPVRFESEFYDFYDAWEST